VVKRDHRSMPCSRSSPARRGSAIWRESNSPCAGSMRDHSTKAGARSGSSPAELEVVAIALVVVACDERAVAVGDLAWLLLPLPPVAVLVVALDLVRGSRSPTGTAREPVTLRRPRLATSGGLTYSRSRPVALELHLSVPARSTPSGTSRARCARDRPGAPTRPGWNQRGSPLPRARQGARAQPPHDVEHPAPERVVRLVAGDDPRRVLCTYQRGREWNLPERHALQVAAEVRFAQLRSTSITPARAVAS